MEPCRGSDPGSKRFFVKQCGKVMKVPARAYFHWAGSSAWSPRRVIEHLTFKQSRNQVVASSNIDARSDIASNVSENVSSGPFQLKKMSAKKTKKANPAKKASKKTVKPVKKAQRPSRKTVKVVKKTASSSTARVKRVKKVPFIKDHVLALEHSKVSENEVKELLAKYQITRREFPKISKSDPAIRDMNLEEGSIVKIKRKSITAGEAYFFREVVNV